MKLANRAKIEGIISSKKLLIETNFSEIEIVDSQYEIYQRANSQILYCCLGMKTEIINHGETIKNQRVKIVLPQYIDITYIKCSVDFELITIKDNVWEIELFEIQKNQKIEINICITHNEFSDLCWHYFEVFSMINSIKSDNIRIYNGWRL